MRRPNACIDINNIDYLYNIFNYSCTAMHVRFFGLINCQIKLIHI